MKKRLLFTMMTLLLTLIAPAFAQESETASITAPVTVDGAAVEGFSARSCDGETYVSFYGVTLALRPDASVEWEEDRLVARGEDFSMSALIGSHYLEVNGRYLYVPGAVRADENWDTLVPAKTLAAALGSEVSWDGTVVFSAAGEPLLSGEEFYDAQTVDLLSRVITHESGNQPLAGKIAVGNVILNRVADSRFPATVWDVLFQPGQFPGATNCTANAESILAAKLCLDGAVTVPGAYWFNGVGKPCWASRNKALLFTIGGHAFYG